MTRKLINLRLPPELVARVDAEAERLGQTRTKFIERALEKALQGTGSLPPGSRGVLTPKEAEDGPPRSSQAVAAPSRAPAKSALSERQARVNQMRKK